MPTASAAAAFPAPVDQALDMFWDIDRWRELWDPIERVEMTYEDPQRQEFVMHVHRGGRLERVRTIRYLRPTSIEFFSPEPPPMMRRHVGEWQFAADGGSGSVVRAVRHYVLYPDGPAPAQFQAEFEARLRAILGRFCSVGAQLANSPSSAAS